VTSNESGTFDIGSKSVHRLGFGAMRLCGDGITGTPDDEAAARDLVRTAVDFIDTADSYGPGVSERLLGEALDDPDDVLVATKAGLLRNRDGEWLAHGEPDYIRNQVLCSLDRLRTETIDLYQFHRPDPDTPFEDSVQTFAELKDEGLVEQVGLSNVSVDQLDTAREYVDVATVQNRYNVGDREEADVLEVCEEYGIGFMPWAPINGDDLEKHGEELEEIASKHDTTRRQVALAWLLERSDVILPIPGTSDPDHLEANLGASQLSLSDDEVDRLTDLEN
jgi:pyridoxine 4-dehydrogenase